MAIGQLTGHRLTTGERYISTADGRENASPRPALPLFARKRVRRDVCVLCSGEMCVREGKDALLAAPSNT